jgi:hypothetical protein
MPQFKSGSTGTIALSLIIAGASAWMGLGANGIYCDRLPSMTIMATLAAFVIALCFRLFARAATRAQKVQLAIALIIAAGALFADVRFVLKYRGICGQLQQQIRQMRNPSQ